MNLDPGEMQKWQGKPKQGIVFRSEDIFIVPFSLLWCGFAVFWESMVVLNAGPSFFVLWGIPFILIGLYMVFGRFIHDMIIRTNSDYYITDKRVIISSLGRIKSIPVGKWSTLQLVEYPDGTGNILFSEPQNSIFRSRSFSNMLSSNLGSTAFFRIENAKYVFDLLQQNP